MNWRHDMTGRVSPDRDTSSEFSAARGVNDARLNGPYFAPISLNAGHVGTSSSFCPSATERYPVSLTSTSKSGRRLTPQSNTSSSRGCSSYSKAFGSDRIVPDPRNVDMGYRRPSKIFLFLWGAPILPHPTSPSLGHACTWRNCSKTILCYPTGQNRKSLGQV